MRFQVIKTPTKVDFTRVGRRRRTWGRKVHYRAADPPCSRSTRFQLLKLQRGPPPFWTDITVPLPARRAESPTWYRDTDPTRIPDRAWLELMETRAGSRRKRGPIIRRFRTVDCGLTRVEILASQARKSTLENLTRSECTREPPPTVDPVPLLVSESFFSFYFVKNKIFKDNLIFITYIIAISFLKVKLSRRKLYREVMFIWNVKLLLLVYFLKVKEEFWFLYYLVFL